MNDSKANDWLSIKDEGRRSLDAAQDAAREAMKADPVLSESYGELLSRLRMAFARGGAPNPKPLFKALGAASESARWIVAILGPTDGVARGIMEALPHFGLDEERRFLAALACAAAEPELTLERLDKAELGSTSRLLGVWVAALAGQPVLDFEEQMKIEVLYHSGEADAAGEKDLQRRYDQARSQFAMHANHHLLRFVPDALSQDPGAYATLLRAMLSRDPYGSLTYFRDPSRPHPFQALSVEDRLDLLDRVASFGLGLASNFLDLFEMPEGPDAADRLKAVFIADLTAGASIYGVYALEGAQNYPFGLKKIEPSLPRRISNAEAVAYLKRDEPESVMARIYTPAEIGNVVTLLQEQEVRRFLELLKADIFLEWKALYSENKRAVIFGDMDLKIRNILYLVAHATFKDNADFDQLLANIGSTHPSTVGNPEHLHLLANRYFFLEVLGLNPGLLFNSPQRAAGALRAPIEDVKNFRILYLLHVAMSIHLNVGEALFQKVPIAWNILLNQGEGGLDSAMQEVVAFFDAFDTLLVLGRSLVPDLKVWLAQIVEALSRSAADVPIAPSETLPTAALRLITREAIARHRETLNAYSIQVLRISATRAGLSTTNILQSLRLPRTKTDKLFALLEEDRKRAGKA